MKFVDWIKIKEQAAVAAPAPAATASTSPSTSSVSSTHTSSGTSMSDIAKVPQRMFSGERQTSDKCRNCSKDFWKNWYYSKKKRKK